MSLVAPKEAHINYQLQYRTCGKASCRACRTGRRHGPCWYAFWREGPRHRNAYIGKAAPPPVAARAARAHHWLSRHLSLNIVKKGLHMSKAKAHWEQMQQISFGV